MTPRHAAKTTALLWAVTLCAALAAASLPGVAAALRDAFAFRLDAGRPATWAEAGDYFTANLRVISALLLAAAARARGGPATLLDVVVTLTALGNAGMVGAAIGAYGLPALPWLVHLPLEWAALGVVLSAYGCGRHRLLTLRALGTAAVAATLLLLAAAATEAWATP